MIQNNEYSTKQIYERDAPTSVGAKHTPSLVRILCTLLVTGFTQAASLESRVIKPVNMEN